MRSTLEYLAIAANRHPHAAAISTDGSVIAFASHKFISLWNPLGSLPLLQLNGRIDTKIARKMTEEYLKQSLVMLEP